MKAARILHPTKALRADNGAPDTGTKYAVIHEYTHRDGGKHVILQNPRDPSQIVIIAREFVEFLNEIVEFYQQDIQPAIDKGKGIFQRIGAWFASVFGSKRQRLTSAPPK